MVKRVVPAIVVGLVFILVRWAVAQQGLSPSSEDEKTRPGEEEIMSAMIKSARVSSQQLISQLNAVLKNQSESKTPRSDFLFCIGSAYRGIGHAQTCVAKAYENGRGVVEDWMEAYLWYALALENKSTAGSTEQNLESEKQRIKEKLQTAYPFPSDEELEDQVRALKERIAQYQSDLKKRKK